jgi:hypothetical protein
MRSSCLWTLAAILLAGLTGCATEKQVGVPFEQAVAALDRLYVAPGSSGMMLATTDEHLPAGHDTGTTVPAGYSRLKRGDAPADVKVQAERVNDDRYRVTIVEGAADLEQRTVVWALRQADGSTKLRVESSDNTRSVFELERDLNYEHARMADLMEMIFAGKLEPRRYYPGGNLRKPDG